MNNRQGARTKKKHGVGNKKASQKKIARVSVFVLGLVFVGFFGYTLYNLFSSSDQQSRLSPVFETYPSQVETEIKQIDRCIYDALLALNIPSDDVIFKTVEPKRGVEGVWTFSELEIRLPATLGHSNIKKTFETRLAERIPKKSLRFSSKSQQKLILDLPVNEHLTHRLVFVNLLKKSPIAASHSNLPRVAIIIDDLGYDEKDASRFLALDGMMSFSVLPHSPFQKSIATTLHRSGRDVLLHLPMEPVEYPQVDPGPGALLSSMTPDELLDQLRKNLDAVPFVVGVNNHMGSRLTKDPAKMRQIFTVLKKRDLFFIDSLTGPRSHCQRVAYLLKLKFAQRQIFLDHVQDENTIRFQVKRLISIARKYGKAIGIGHPYPATWKVLNEELPNIKNQVKLVRISELVG